MKGEFIPSLIKNQFKKQLATDQFNPYNIEASNELLAKKKDDSTKKSVYSYIFVDELRKELDRFDPLIDEKESKEDCKSQLNYPLSLFACSPVVVDKEKYFISRSSNLHSYYEINKLARILVPNHLNSNFGRAQITADCLIGDNNKINEKTSIKKTIIGSNCTISEKVRLENCLIMDNVAINELCVIKNSIICNNVVILQKSSLTNCIVASNEQIDESTILTNESIVHHDQMIEI